MPTIPLIPIKQLACELDPDLITVSTDCRRGVVATVFQLGAAFYVTVTYPGPPCQSWAVAGALADRDTATECASVLLSDRRLH